VPRSILRLPSHLGTSLTQNLFTHDEVVLCAYIAMHGRGNITEDVVERIKHRSVGSIKMKVQNIAAMLREEGYGCSSQVPSLTGRPAGMKGRRTNWDVVRALPLKDKAAFLSLCNEVIENMGKNDSPATATVRSAGVSVHVAKTAIGYLGHRNRRPED
jgi:hypothetical protein